MRNFKRIILICLLLICAAFVVVDTAHMRNLNSYPGMHCISSSITYRNTENGNRTIDLPGLRTGQLVVIETEPESGFTSSWISYLTPEAFSFQSKEFEHGRLEYEVIEDANYMFQLNGEKAGSLVLISVWEATRTV